MPAQVGLEARILGPVLELAMERAQLATDLSSALVRIAIRLSCRLGWD